MGAAQWHYGTKLASDTDKKGSSDLRADRVLVASADVLLRERLAGFWRLLPVDALEVESPGEAAAAVQSGTLDLVLVDQEMLGAIHVDPAKQLGDPPVVLPLPSPDSQPDPELLREACALLDARRQRQGRPGLLGCIVLSSAEAERDRTAAGLLVAALTGHCPDPVVATGRQGQIVFCNDAAARLCATSREELLGTPFASVLVVDAPATLPVSSSPGERQVRVLEGSVYCVATGAMALVEAVTATHSDAAGRLIGTVIMLRDVTAVRQLVRELTDANQRLQAVNARLEALSHTDSLTTVHNHRFFHERLRQEQAAARRYGYNVSLLMLDIDDFKTVNDTYGHVTGDRVLRAVARALETELRETDVLCRYGGEEFTVILGHTPASQVHDVAERLRRAVGRLHEVDPSVPSPVTASFGGATLRPDERHDSLIDRADGALYRAKRAGKNNVVVDDR